MHTIVRSKFLKEMIFFLDLLQIVHILLFTVLTLLKILIEPLEVRNKTRCLCGMTQSRNNRNFRNLSFFAILTLGFTSCDISKSTNGLIKTQATANSLSYNYTENGCSTGEHTFYANDQLCDGLKNDSLNNYCALSLRHSRYQTDCAGRGTW